MTMLSRVAERLFWLARYLERAEDVARLAAAYNHLVLDIPKGNEPGWEILINTLDAGDAYLELHRKFNERGIFRFLIANPNQGSSIHYAISAVRENIRTTRDVLPEEAWEYINELYLYSQEMAEKSLGRRTRFEYLERVITGCQMFNGLVLSTLPRDHAYRFIKLGSLLERADMATRVIDVGAAQILGRETADPTIESLLWSNLLKSLSAIGAYRQHVGPLVSADDVIDFVFRELTLPRSVRFCLNGMHEELLALPDHHSTTHLINQLIVEIQDFSAEQMSFEQVHGFIDEFQIQLDEVSNRILNTWCRTA